MRLPAPEQHFSEQFRNKRRECSSSTPAAYPDDYASFYVSCANRLIAPRVVGRQRAHSMWLSGSEQRARASGPPPFSDVVWNTRR